MALASGATLNLILIRLTHHSSITIIIISPWCYEGMNRRTKILVRHSRRAPTICRIWTSALRRQSYDTSAHRTLFPDFFALRSRESQAKRKPINWWDILLSIVSLIRFVEYSDPIDRLNAECTAHTKFQWIVIKWMKRIESFYVQHQPMAGIRDRQHSPRIAMI